MKYNIRGDKIVITKAINDYIISKLDRLNKYLKDTTNITARVIVKITNHEQKIEVTIPLKDITLRAEERNDNLYSAIDLVVDKLERQISKNKTRLMTRYAKEPIINDSLIEENGDEKNTIVRRKKLETKPMDEEEAILEMNLLGHDFFIFKDSDTLRINILYRRKDGNYGIIET